jgi:thiol-disulfide isomerase/thioredoxin
MRMLGRLKLKVARSACLAVALLVMVPLPAASQTIYAPNDPVATNSDALAFLKEVFERYARATSYHIESVEELSLIGEFNRTWTKTLTTAIVGHSNQFRFETRGDHGNGLQISDGKTEWVYYPPFRQYIQHAAPSTGPSNIQAPGLRSLTAAHNILQGFSSLQKLIRTAVYAPDESIEVNGDHTACAVIRTEGELPGGSSHISTRFIFWIEKRTKVIRKMTEHREGPLHPTEPDIVYVLDRTALYPVADLTPSSSTDQNFTFKPPITASLVREFESNDRVTMGIRQFVGKQAPEISLKTADGNDVPLKSLRGRPVLLDFWATWCTGCVYSLPRIEKLYQETAKKGLILLSIDEDEEPRTGDEFWSKHNEPWQNLRGNTDALGHFPDHGIPYFVLIDASGQVVFSAAGLDETALRAALSKLDPGFASLSQIPTP